MSSACGQFALCGHSDLVIYHPISSKFHIHVLSTFFKLWPKFEYRLCQLKNNQDGCQNGPCLWSICPCVHSNLVIYHRVASKFHIWITFITCPSSNTCFVWEPRWLSKWPPPISLHLWLSNLVIYHLISSKFHIWITLSNFCPSLNMGFVRWTITKMSSEMAAAYDQFALVDTLV